LRLSQGEIDFIPPAKAGEWLLRGTSCGNTGKSTKNLSPRTKCGEDIFLTSQPPSPQKPPPRNPQPATRSEPRHQFLKSGGEIILEVLIIRKK
jgi:hypothetical protein